jgi:pimeloyl-ACP methyl ester carboxylesterase
MSSAGTARFEPRTTHYRGADGNALVGDVVGAGPLVLLLHGGGQTRQSWSRTADALARAGHTALSLDLRGHGDSDWSADARYGFAHNAADLLAVLAHLDERPALVGASMGGITAIVALGQSPNGGLDLARSLVLVDVTPRMEPAGLARIAGFMRAAPDGFASLGEAAAAVAAYLPGRARPASTSGLVKNLRLGPDERYHWHWDPRILDSMPTGDQGRHALLSTAARAVRVPTMLVRGSRSDVVSDEGVRELQELIPQAVIAEVSDAGHMVAGDDNDDFTASILEFVRGS